ncbi:hypothetical protein LO772_14840 [Yinghuangia sp. ASG 101]|nr:hypothetical protein [Yinghuangia sp. ASG 101]UGQ14734.1 hypothetical protein LO772_14840 [Yinghuangia sp. ASG 101]
MGAEGVQFEVAVERLADPGAGDLARGMPQPVRLRDAAAPFDPQQRLQFGAFGMGRRCGDDAPGAACGAFADGGDSRSSTVAPGSSTLFSTRYSVARSNSAMGRSFPDHARSHSHRDNFHHAGPAKSW